MYYILKVCCIFAKNLNKTMEHTQNIKYESEFWLMMYKEQKNKVKKLEKELNELKNKFKECGIGNDHEDFNHSNHYLS